MIEKTTIATNIMVFYSKNNSTKRW